MPRIPEKQINLKEMKAVKDKTVLDHETGEFVTIEETAGLSEGIVKIIGDKCIKGLFTPVLSKNIYAQLAFGPNQNQGSMLCISKDIVQNTDKIIYYNAKKGVYCITSQDIPVQNIAKAESILGIDNFPYFFKRDYAAESNLKLFTGREVVEKGEPHKYANLLKYTFGLEFETSAGYIPQEECFRNGLIPLRDGSISGLEYATIVMNSKNGPGLISQQVESLRKRTVVNKECSLHMHLGDFPVNGSAILRLWNLLYDLQDELGAAFLPTLAFNTEDWKKSKKSYCKKLESKFTSIEALYKWASMGESYYGSLTQPHPSDPEKTSKWNIKTRYYWINIIGMLFYKTAKTVEFRILAPTFNYNKIMGWLYVFNAILQYAENPKNNGNPGLHNIMYAIYPKEFANNIGNFLNDCSLLRNAQMQAGDYYGELHLLDDIAFEGDYDF